MAEWTLAPVTIPTPEPYAKSEPTKQLENLCYVLLQMLAQSKQTGWVFSDTPATGTPSDLTGIENALKELKWNGMLLDLGPIKVVLGPQSPLTILQT